MKKCHCEDGCECEGNECECEHGPLVIELEDENGEQVKVEIVGSFDDNDKSYAIANDLGNPENSYLFEIQSTDEGDMLVSIDDEAEFDRLCKVIEEKIK